MFNSVFNETDWKQQFINASNIVNIITITNLLVQKGIITSEEIEKEEQAVLDQNPDVRATIDHSHAMIEYFRICKKSDFTEGDEKFIKEEFSKYVEEAQLKDILNQLLARREIKESE